MTMQRDRTMDADKRRKSDEHPEGQGGETKLPCRRKQGTRNLSDCVWRDEPTAWRILVQSTESRRGVESNRNRMPWSTRFQGGDHHEQKHSERVISFRVVLPWKGIDSGHKAKAMWCVHGFKDLDIHEIERSRSWREGTLAHGEKAFMQGDPRVRDETTVRHFASRRIAMCT